MKLQGTCPANMESKAHPPTHLEGLSWFRFSLLSPSTSVEGKTDGNEEAGGGV